MSENLNESAVMQKIPPMFVKPGKAPHTAPGIRIRSVTPFGHMHLTVVLSPATERELEVFAQIGKSAELLASDLEGLCRLTSLYLRAGGSLADVIDQMIGIGSAISLRPDFNGEREKTYSLADSYGKTLQAYFDFKSKHGAKAILLGEVDSADEIDIR